MAWSLAWYKDTLLAEMWDEEARRRLLMETPWFNMLANTNQTSSIWMDMMSPNSSIQQYDPEQMRVEALNREVETWLWTRIDDVMSDREKQYYLNHLTKNQYEQMLKYKNEWYWFMASKALMENSYKLADPNAEWLLKYKDFAEKDAYYNNSLLTPWEPIETPTSQLANWWNERYSKNVQYWINDKWETYVIRDDNGFWNRLANISFGTLVNLLDTWVTGMMNIMDKWQSALWSALDKAILWYDTDVDFYRQSDTTLINDVAQVVWSSASLALLWAWVASSPMWMAWMTALGATKPWWFVLDLTFWNLNKLVSWTLDNVDYKDYLNRQSVDSLSNAITLWISIWLARVWWPKIQNSKVWAYYNTIKWMVKNWIEKWVDYAKVQADFENFNKQKTWVEREPWTFVSSEEYQPWYKWRVLEAGWEWFKEWFMEKFNNPNGTSLSWKRNTGYQVQWQWVERTTWESWVGNKTNTNNTQSQWKVNTLWAMQLRQWNKMNKTQGIKFVNRYWTDYWTWMAQRWFNQSYENNVKALIDYEKYMQKQKEQALATVTQRYQDQDVLDMLNDSIDRAIYIKSDDVYKLLNLKRKYDNWWLTMTDEDYIRQRFWYNFPLKFDWTDVSWTVQRNNNMYDRVKNVLERQAEENWITQLKDINREIAATYHIIEWTTRYYNWLGTNDIISLKDLITLASTIANPKARPMFVIQQALKMPKVKDAILSKLIKGKTNEERTQIKIDFEKIKEIQDEAEQRRLLEEWIAKWNLKIEEAMDAMKNRLPETITQWWIEAWDKWFPTTNPSSPTYWELWLWNIKETFNPQYLIRAIIQQLKDMKLLKDINEDMAVNFIMSNMSPNAQDVLTNISQKMANWWQLTEQEWDAIQKLAEVIRDNQEWLDNWEPTDYTPTNLPTNPIDNGWGITEWGQGWNIEGWMGGSWAWDENNVWMANWWWNQETFWEDVTELWTTESWFWPTKEEIRRVNNSKEYEDIKWNIIEHDGRWISMWNEWLNNFDKYKIYTTPQWDWMVAVDNNWQITELIIADDAPKWAVDELVLRAIDEWANKIIVESESQVAFFERLWFNAIVTTWYKDISPKYFMIHNGDASDIVRDNMWNYVRNVSLFKLKRMNYDKAVKYMNDMMDENVWYELSNIKWWDGEKNREWFNNKFKTPEEIRDYIQQKYRKLTNHTTAENEEKYNKELAETTEIYNWHIDFKQMWVIYVKDISELQTPWKKWTTLAQFNRGTASLKIWTSRWFTVSHEDTHWLNYIFWKELTWLDIELSNLVSYLAWRWWKLRPKRNQYPSKAAELIWEFVDIYKSIRKRWFDEDDAELVWLAQDYIADPSEKFARVWEAFVNFVKTWKPISTDWEIFSKRLMVRIAEWLGKMDEARVNWDLFECELQIVNKKRMDAEGIDVPWIWRVYYQWVYYRL